MPRNQEREHAREAVAAYHQANLAELLTHVADAMDRFRDGDVDAFEVDHVLFQYSRAAKELWKFCNLGTSRSPRTTYEKGAQSTGGNAALQERVSRRAVMHHQRPCPVTKGVILRPRLSGLSATLGRPDMPMSEWITIVHDPSDGHHRRTPTGILSE